MEKSSPFERFAGFAPAESLPTFERLDFRRWVENLPVGAYMCDADGLITYFNQLAEQLWGRAPKLNDPADRFCGSFKLYAADGSPIAHDQCWMALALRDRKAYNAQEILIERPDGRRMTVLAHANPLWDEHGELIGAINVLVDVSDRSRADRAESLLAAIVKSSDDAIYSRDLPGRILSWNAGAERLYGYEADEIIGQPIQLITPPEKLEPERAIVERICFYERVEHFETVRLTKDGRRVDISLTMSPIHDSSGRIVGISKIGRDITAQKEAEKAFVALKDTLAQQLADLLRLHEMSMRLSTTLELEQILNESLRAAAALEGTDLGLLSLCDGEQDVLHVGASLGFDDEFLRTVDNLAPGGCCGTCFEQRQRVIVEDTETDLLFAPYRDVARRHGFRAVHSTPLITRSGEIVGVLSTYFRGPHRPSDREIHLNDLCARQAVDFIENAQLYSQLRDADRRKDEFLATLAHELRNPLAPISNALHILHLSGEMPPATERVRDIMEQQCNHMIRLVEDLLEVSRFTRGKIELRKEPVELARVIQIAVDTSRPLIEAAGHQLAIAITPDVIILDADPVRLAQIISNLLNNAAKYTELGGQIWLSAERDGKEVVISVRDTGLGIPADMLPRVFDMFAQVDPTLKRSQGGLGIGLSLAKNLVQMHGGQIEAYSAGPGKGSEFIVRLPMLAATVTAVAASSSPPARIEPLPMRHILVVDDARAAVYILGRLLEALGQQVRTANSAVAALEIVQNERPDVVISDIAMPNMDGYELAHRLRQLPGMEGVVLVALTGYGQDADRKHARESGFDYHLVKPVSLNALQTLLASLREPADAPVPNGAVSGVVQPA